MLKQNKLCSHPDTAIDRNINVITSIPKCLLKSKNIHPRKDVKTKLKIDRDLRWVNDYFNLKKQHKNTKQQTNNISCQPKRKTGEQNNRKIRPKSTKRAVINNKNNNNNNINNNQHNIILKSNKQNINGNTSNINNYEQGRFGILSNKTIVKALEYSGILEHQKKIRQLQNHARRMSCQLGRLTNQNGNIMGNCSISMHSQDNQNQYDLQKSQIFNKQIAARLQTVRNNNTNKNISDGKSNLIYIKFTKLSQKQKNRRNSQNMFILKKSENISMELQPWSFHKNTTKQVKEEDQFLENYVIGI